MSTAPSSSFPLPKRRALPPEQLRAAIAAAQGGDLTARNEVIEANLRLVASVAQRFAALGREWDDLFQVGCIGLTKAVERFDPSYDVQFSTYAVPLIAGEIRQHLRKDNAVHVSRRTQEKAIVLRRVLADLQQSLGRSPTMRELAEATGAELDEVAAALETLRQPASLDEEAADGEGQSSRLHDRIADDNPWWEHALDRLGIHQVIGGLDERERLILQLRFLERRTQTEAAGALGISQPQFSRTERRLLDKLRDLLS
ncbi:MAG TPA: SigB/SigF/SigG family RNA polymerase sigma factor [Limnochordia bacterium]|nr:SigB/SigF/SigG family RNA polymerase sigma factor [Limnochordia bacterium]